MIQLVVKDRSLCYRNSSRDTTLSRNPATICWSYNVKRLIFGCHDTFDGLTAHAPCADRFVVVTVALIFETYSELKWLWCQTPNSIRLTDYVQPSLMTLQRDFCYITDVDIYIYSVQDDVTVKLNTTSERWRHHFVIAWPKILSLKQLHISLYNPPPQFLVPIQLLFIKLHFKKRIPPCLFLFVFLSFVLPEIKSCVTNRFNII